jgi:hypothetical protein
LDGTARDWPLFARKARTIARRKVNDLPGDEAAHERLAIA